MRIIGTNLITFRQEPRAKKQENSQMRGVLYGNTEDKIDIFFLRLKTNKAKEERTCPGIEIRKRKPQTVARETSKNCENLVH